MSSIQNRLSERHSKKQYLCHVCKGKHGLRDCKTFLSKDVQERLKLVISHRYCPNCLAHQHSAGSCFSKNGCKRCGSNHNTLLHITKPQRIHQRKYTSHSKGPQKPKPSTSSQPLANKIRRETTKRTVTIASIASPHLTTLFPTAMVLLLKGTKQYHVRAVVDPCTSVSKISKMLVDERDLPTTKLGEETICAVTLCSRHAPNPTLQTTMKVNNHISMITPNKSIDSSISVKFSNLILADPKFYQSKTFDIVLGADVYGKIIQPGLLPSTGDLPVAISTIFGWVLCGTCNT